MMNAVIVCGGCGVPVDSSVTAYFYLYDTAHEKPRLVDAPRNTI